MAIMIDGVKHYPVSQKMFDRLDDMYQRATEMTGCCDESLTAEQYMQWQALAAECAQLRYKAEETGYLSGPDYGRMKEITTERAWMGVAR